MQPGRGFITTHTLLSLPLKACPHGYNEKFFPGQLALRCRDVMTQTASAVAGLEEF